MKKFLEIKNDLVNAALKVTLGRLPIDQQISLLRKIGVSPLGKDYGKPTADTQEFIFPLHSPSVDQPKEEL